MVLCGEPRTKLNAFIIDFWNGGVFAKKKFQYGHDEQQGAQLQQHIKKIEYKVETNKSLVFSGVSQKFKNRFHLQAKLRKFAVYELPDAHIAFLFLFPCFLSGWKPIRNFN
jgi:hypothetical protein